MGGGRRGSEKKNPPPAGRRGSEKKGPPPPARRPSESPGSVKVRPPPPSSRRASGIAGEVDEGARRNSTKERAPPPARRKSRGRHSFNRKAQRGGVLGLRWRDGDEVGLDCEEGDNDGFQLFGLPPHLLPPGGGSRGGGAGLSSSTSFTGFERETTREERRGSTSASSPSRARRVLSLFNKPEELQGRGSHSTPNDSHHHHHDHDHPHTNVKQHVAPPAARGRHSLYSRPALLSPLNNPPTSPATTTTTSPARGRPPPARKHTHTRARTDKPTTTRARSLPRSALSPPGTRGSRAPSAEPGGQGGSGEELGSQQRGRTPSDAWELESGLCRTAEMTYRVAQQTLVGSFPLSSLARTVIRKRSDYARGDKQRKKDYYHAERSLARSLTLLDKKKLNSERHKVLKAGAMDCFLCILSFMGDLRDQLFEARRLVDLSPTDVNKEKLEDALKRAKGYESPVHAGLALVTKAFHEVDLQTEVFLQLVKQTTNHAKDEHSRRGWQLLYLCLRAFRPKEDILKVLLDHIVRFAPREFLQMSALTTSLPHLAFRCFMAYVVGQGNEFVPSLPTLDNVNLYLGVDDRSASPDHKTTGYIEASSLTTNDEHENQVLRVLLQKNVKMADSEVFELLENCGDREFCTVLPLVLRSITSYLADLKLRQGTGLQTLLEARVSSAPVQQAYTMLRSANLAEMYPDYKDTHWQAHGADGPPTCALREAILKLTSHPPRRGDTQELSVFAGLAVHPFHPEHSISTLVVEKIFNSNARPILVKPLGVRNAFAGKEGTDIAHANVARLPHFIIKQGDDLRQDVCVMMVQRGMNILWRQENLLLNAFPVMAVPFGVLPVTEELGCLEFVPDCISCKDVKTIGKFARSAVERFVTTAAGAFMASFVLGVRDRHHDNILVNRSDGSLFHIDFGHILGDEVSIDTASVAITQDLQAVMMQLGMWATFIDLSVQAFSALRKNSGIFLKYATWVLSGLAEGDTVQEFLEGRLYMQMPADKATKRIRQKFETAPDRLKTMLKNKVHTAAVKLAG